VIFHNILSNNFQHYQVHASKQHEKRCYFSISSHAVKIVMVPYKVNVEVNDSSVTFSLIDGIEGEEDFSSPLFQDSN
jgi:hypothetical protein